MSCNPIYPDENIQMLGVVLCGGKSSRMGEDKGLLKITDKTWTELALIKLEGLSIPVCVSINPSQKEQYQSFLHLELLVEDSIEDLGPLTGLLSVHNQYPYHDLIILACDMIDIPEFIIDKLYKEFRSREGEHDFFVYKFNDEFEPLLGIYTREGLQKIADLYTLGQIGKPSMKHILEMGNTYAIPISEEEYAFFSNYNSPQNLSEIR